MPSLVPAWDTWGGPVAWHTPHQAGRVSWGLRDRERWAGRPAALRKTLPALCGGLGAPHYVLGQDCVWAAPTSLCEVHPTPVWGYWGSSWVCSGGRPGTAPGCPPQVPCLRCHVGGSRADTSLARWGTVTQLSHVCPAHALSLKLSGVSPVPSRHSGARMGVPPEGNAPCTVTPTPRPAFRLCPDAFAGRPSGGGWGASAVTKPLPPLPTARPRWRTLSVTDGARGCQCVSPSRRDRQGPEGFPGSSAQ